jgi:hypothetical protein
MDKKNKIFFTVFFGLIAVVVAVTFVKYFILKSYYIQTEGDCDPTVEKCFIWECDPEATEEGEKCTGDPETDTWYYQKVKKLANEIAPCDPNDETCDALLCDQEIMDCEVTFCDENTVGEGEVCNDPVKYNEENPIEEEGEECAEDDEECLAAEAEAEECAADDEECLNAEELDDSESSEDSSATEDGSEDSAASDEPATAEAL